MRTLPASLGGKDGIPLIKVEFETTLAKDGSTRATAYHKSNKIITAGGRIFVGWLDVGNNSCVASCDLKTKTWSQTVILGDGQDNHAGPALAIDSQGFLYAMFGPHWAQPFRFRKSLKPYDASEWTPAAKLYPEWNCSYPSMVFDAQDMLPRGTPQQITDEVHRVRDLLGPSVIISPSHEAVLPDVPPENVAAMAAAATEPACAALTAG